MRWRGERQSDNVEDRRGMSISRGAKVGGIGGLGLVAIVVISMFMGVDPSSILQVVEQNTQSSSISVEQAQPQPPMTMRAILSRWCWRKRRMSGTMFFSRRDAPMKNRNLYCFPRPLNPHAAWPDRPQDLFIVRPITRFTSTWHFSKSCIHVSAHPVISPRRTSSPMK